MDDVGLQQAILASLQSATQMMRSGAPPPPPPRSYYGPSFGTSGTPNVTRTPVAASRQRDIQPTMPRYAPVGGGGGAGGAGGRRNVLEREGIAPTTPYRAGVPPRRRGVASCEDDTFEATGSDFVGFTHSSSPNGGWDNSTDIVHDAYPHLLGSRAGPLSRHAPPLTSQRPRPVAPAPTTTSSTADFGAPPSRQRATSSGVGGRGAYAGGGRAVSDAATLPVSGWHELPGIGGGGRVVRQNPSGSHFGLECGMHQPPLDAQLTAIAHSQLLLVAGGGAAAVKGTTVVLSLNVKPSTRGVVFFVGVDSSGHAEDGYGTPPPAQSRLDGASSHRALTRFSGASILFSAEAPFITSDTFAVEGEGIVRVARQDRPHALKVPARGLEAGLNVTMYVSSGSLAFEVNGERVIRNLPVSSLRSPTDARLILAAAGGRVMVKNVAIENGEAARQRKAAADPKLQAKAVQDRGFVSIVESEMLEQSPNVQWEDVAALGDAKRLLNEAVICPLSCLSFSLGCARRGRACSSTGRQAQARPCWPRQSRPAPRPLFSPYRLRPSTANSSAKARSSCAPFSKWPVSARSTIFIDEIDAIMMRRGEGTEHEASRRVKTEILQQLDGIGTGGADEPRVIILAATNRPWDLDDAMRRRLEKRIYVPLPDAAARAELLRLLAKKVRVEPTVDFAQLATALDGYSCADIHVLCRDAAMMPMRRLIADKSPTEIVAMKEAGLLAEPPALSEADFRNSIRKIQPSVAQTDLARFDSWTKEFGAM